MTDLTGQDCDRFGKCMISTGYIDKISPATSCQNCTTRRNPAPISDFMDSLPGWVKGPAVALRIVRNAPLTAVGTGIAALQSLDCRSASNGLRVCGGASWGYGGSGTAYGEVFITRQSTADALIQPDLLAHEQGHSWEQAGLGTRDFLLVYFSTYLISGGCNVFEGAAGFKAGGYTSC